jgi:hypothetical protein
VCYEEKRNEVSDELAFSFLNKVKKSLTSSNKKERTAKID